MNKCYDLELNIMSCLLQKPKLMKQLVIDDRYFVRYRKLWGFMKAFYKKYETFDLTLMYRVCADKYQIVDYIQMLLDVTPTPSLFLEYQEQLVREYKETKKEKWIIQNIYDYANELYVRNITIDDFKNGINKICLEAEKIFND